MRVIEARLLSALHTGASAVCSLAVAPHLAVTGFARCFFASLVLAQRPNSRLARKHLSNPTTARCGATANEHAAEAPVCRGLRSLTYRSLNWRNFPIPNSNITEDLLRFYFRDIPPPQTPEYSAYWSLSCVFIGCCLTPGSYGIRKMIPCKPAIGSEACGECLINCDPVAKVTGLSLDYRLSGHALDDFGPMGNYLQETGPDKIDVKHVYTEVDFVSGSQFMRHVLDDSEPIADLQTASEQTSEARVYTWPWSLAYRSLNSRIFPIPMYGFIPVRQSVANVVRTPGGRTPEEHVDSRLFLFRGQGTAIRTKITCMPGDLVALTLKANRIRLERASLKQSSDTHKTPYDRVKRCREHKINIRVSERVNVDPGICAVSMITLPHIHSTRNNALRNTTIILAARKLWRGGCSGGREPRRLISTPAMYIDSGWVPRADDGLSAAAAKPLPGTSVLTTTTPLEHLVDGSPDPHGVVRPRAAKLETATPTNSTLLGYKGIQTRRPAASSGTIPTCEDPESSGPGIEPGSPWWEASRLTAHPPANPLRLLGRKIMQGDMHSGKEGLGSPGLHFGTMTTSLSVLRAGLNYEEQGKNRLR
ncbi:hypothetical protein PR048_027365 [Dryococelus australis]|uniref:Uncharacterized protein n=1 Tax=Dryococelus australis TaxID=614101 RepID=A0ABQ9GGC1_9NEOP|nr:hypothetical protein PR048_027365 [Dryococelus australis]